MLIGCVCLLFVLFGKLEAKRNHLSVKKILSLYSRRSIFSGSWPLSPLPLITLLCPCLLSFVDGTLKDTFLHGRQWVGHMLWSEWSGLRQPTGGSKGTALSCVLCISLAWALSQHRGHRTRTIPEPRATGSRAYRTRISLWGCGMWGASVQAEPFLSSARILLPICANRLQGAPWSGTRPRARVESHLSYCFTVRPRRGPRLITRGCVKSPGIAKTSTLEGPRFRSGVRFDWNNKLHVMFSNMFYRELVQDLSAWQLFLLFPSHPWAAPKVLFAHSLTP